MKKILKYFSPFEWTLWLGSCLAVILSFFLLKQTYYLSLIASLTGVTFLIFNAKGNPIGQLLTVVFSILYGIISFSYSYYGEMVTYLGMTLPMAAAALVTWLRNPFRGRHSEVEINHIKKKEWLLLALLTASVTVAFYFILGKLGTANLIPSTFSVTTSFTAAYLTLRRSPWYAFFYAMNDAVLIVLWVLAIRTDISYISVVICFCVFLINDLYGFINWRRMGKEQLKQN